MQFMYVCTYLSTVGTVGTYSMCSMCSLYSIYGMYSMYSMYVCTYVQLYLVPCAQYLEPSTLYLVPSILYPVPSTWYLVANIPDILHMRSNIIWFFTKTVLILQKGCHFKNKQTDLRLSSLISPKNKYYIFNP